MKGRLIAVPPYFQAYHLALVSLTRKTDWIRVNSEGVTSFILALAFTIPMSLNRRIKGSCSLHCVTEYYTNLSLFVKLFVWAFQAFRVRLLIRESVQRSALLWSFLDLNH